MALADDESVFVRADVELVKMEVESAKEAIENFKNLEEFKEEILEDRFTSY